MATVHVVKAEQRDTEMLANYAGDALSRSAQRTFTLSRYWFLCLRNVCNTKSKTEELSYNSNAQPSDANAFFIGETQLTQELWMGLGFGRAIESWTPVILHRIAFGMWRYIWQLARIYWGNVILNNYIGRQKWAKWFSVSDRHTDQWTLWDSTRHNCP